MNARTQRFWMCGCRAGVTAVLIAGVCGCQRIGVYRAGRQAPPPAPPVTEAATSQPVYDKPRLPRRLARRWTVALLRVGDTRPIPDVPFGEDTPPQRTPSTNTGTQIEIRIGSPSLSDARPAERREPPPNLNHALRRQLKRVLLDSGWFNVVERDRILEILREIRFSRTPYVDPETAPPAGSLICVRYLLEGAIRTWNPAARRAGQGGGPCRNILTGGSLGERQLMALRAIQARKLARLHGASRRVICELTLYDAFTGELVAAVTGAGRDVPRAMDDAVEALAAALLEVQADPRIAAVDDATVYLDLGTGSGLRVGDRLTVFRPGKPVRDVDGILIGYTERPIGSIRVREVRRALSVAEVVERREPFRRGDIVRLAR